MNVSWYRPCGYLGCEFPFSTLIFESVSFLSSMTETLNTKKEGILFFWAPFALGSHEQWADGALGAQFGPEAGSRGQAMEPHLPFLTC